MLKTIAVAVAVIMVGLLFCCCRVRKAYNEADDKIQIGFVTDSYLLERWQKDQDHFMQRAKELGAEVLVKYTGESSEEQIRVVEDIIQQDIDVLVIIPYDKDALSVPIKKARDRGIKVIAYDRLVMNAPVDLYISFNNYDVGRLMAQSLLQAVPRGNYVIINGSIYDHNSTMINQGYLEVLQTAIDNGDIMIVDDTWANVWRSEIAYDYINELLASGVVMDAVLCGNDTLAEGAIKALSENMLAGQVMVSGQDTELAACQRIVEGTQYVSIYKPIKILAEGAAEAAISLAKGEPVKANGSINNGSYMIPYIMYEPIAVTKYNIDDTVIADKFHLREEVYRNIPPEQWP